LEGIKRTGTTSISSDGAALESGPLGAGLRRADPELLACGPARGMMWHGELLGNTKIQNPKSDLDPIGHHKAPLNF